MKSVWSESVELQKFNKLEGDTSCDVLIIGGGLAGILCAYFLKEAGINYLLVEGETICDGITKNTTAKITAQHGLIYSKLIKDFGENKAKQYLAANLWAVKKFSELCKNIPCDFEEKSAYVYTLSDRKKIEDEVNAVNKLGFGAELVEKVPLPLNVKAAIRFKNQAQFNPLKFVAGIVNGMNIREHTFVKKVKDNIAYTDNGNIKAKKIVIATHFPFINSRGWYFIKLYQSRSYTIALENAPDVAGMYVDEAENGMSFRNYQNLLLIGGGDHRTGKPGGMYEELRNFAKTRYRGAVELYSWATQDCMSLDSIPYIGRYSPNTPNMYVATGFNKWGMTSSMVSAKILSDMIQEEKINQFADVFSPDRSIFTKQLFVNLGDTVVNLLTPSTKRCSHLGCSLKWNKTEHTWECPCHGSRFDEKGKLIDNPAMRNTDVK
jgi:glycine/D-amino acid oxidase-like deaminating enzyme